MIAMSLQVMLAGNETYWMLWSALILALMQYGDRFYTRVGAIIVTGTIVAMGALLSSLLSLIMPLFVLYLAIVTFVSAYIMQRNPNYFYPVLIINLLIITSGMVFSPLVSGIERAEFVLLGTAIACGCQLIFLPFFLRSETQSLVMRCLVQMEKLENDIFSFYLNPDYSENVYLFEHRMHKQKNKCMQLLLSLHELESKKIKTSPTVIILEQIFDSLLAIAQLRHRVTDHTIFAVCFNEMNAIHEEITKNMHEMLAVYRHKNPYMNTSGLQDKIERLEENYQTVLQVTSREPMMFLLFITSLKSLQREIEAFYLKGNECNM
jgi:hypothetical protein